MGTALEYEYGTSNTYTMSGKARYSYAQAILGKDLFARVQHARILCVGAGGIGCEVLKNLVQVGFGDITIIDLDTIDLSNLNRQFLFQKQHVKLPKALVAKETANKFNPSVDIKAIHGNIKEPQYDAEWFKSFDLVMNALDNLDARRHVNKMCLAADVPLIESGTAGFIGQVQPIKKDLTECYDCQPKETPKGFPVCTIRSTPSTPIHCIVWAKSYLFPALFGVDDEQDSLELDKAAQAGENPDEINNLRQEALAMKALRQSLGTDGFQKRVVERVFKEDVERLLSMEDMWKHRTKPTPLDYDQLAAAASTSGAASNGAGGIKDQRILNTKDSFDLFVDSLARLAARADQDPLTPLEWDKDDDDALDFATSAANLRASVFSIPLKTRFDVKQMAGNIIPAIATTNAIIAGAIILQALHALRKNWSAARSVWFGRTAQRALNSTNLEKPNPGCSTCRTPYVPLKVDAAKLTLQTFIDEVLKGWMGADWDVGIVDGSRLLYDPDFEDNLEKTFENLKIGQGSHLQVNDEEGDKMPVVFVLSKLGESDKVYETSGTPPTIPDKPKLEQPSEPEKPQEDAATTNARKRTASDAQLEVPELKKTKFDANGTILLDDDEDDDLVLVL